MEAYLEACMEALRSNGFEVVLAKDAQQAQQQLLDRIEAGKQVGVGGSITIREIGVLPELEKKGCTLHAHWGLQGEEAEAAMRRAREADVYLCSANAITRSGKLVLVDGRGNRVGAICDGPAQVFVVASCSKVVDGGLEAAIARVKRDAAPPNCKRLSMDTPCARTGKCGGKECLDPSCRLTLTVDHVPRKRHITVVLVEEKLGY